MLQNDCIPIFIYLFVCFFVYLFIYLVTVEISTVEKKKLIFPPHTQSRVAIAIDIWGPPIYNLNELSEF